MRSILLVLGFVGFLAIESQAQCVNGVCQMRTPVRSTVASIVQAAPVRRTVNAVRPANWRVFSNARASCSGVSVQSCSGSAPTAVQTATAVAEVATVDAQGLISDRASFRRSLKTATRNQVAAGNITQAQAFLLNGLAFFPAKADAIMAAVHDAAIDEGLATTQAIDWEGLAGFIERILPLILQLIQLFG